MSGRRDIVGELLTIKSRRGRDEHMAYAYTHELDEIVNRAEDDRDPILKLVPVRSVTLIEVFTRGTIAQIIGEGSPYIERAERLFKQYEIKPDYRTITALHGQIVTVGDVLAHMMRLHRLEDIGNAISTLLNIDFIVELSCIHERFASEVMNKKEEPILGPSATWYPAMERVFELRNIVVHESSPSDLVSVANAKVFADTTKRFIKAFWELVANTLQPNYPLSQAGMNEVAGEQFDTANAELLSLTLRIEEKLQNDPRALALFRDMQEKWEQLRAAQMLFSHDPETGGSMGPCIRLGAGAFMTRERIKYCADWLKREEGEY